MADKKDLEKSEAATDPELDELLDSALEDLTKKPPQENAAAKETKKVEDATEPNFDDQKWTNDFIRQAAAQFETNMASLFSGQDGAVMSEENIQQNFQKMAEAAAQVMANPTMEPSPQANDFAATISQTLQNLSLEAEHLQNPFSEQDIAGMFGNVAPDTNQFLPLMQGMMQSLLSKEVLYTSLKDILDRYPAWLDEKRAQLSSEDIERYEKQITLMTSVCNELENENESDSENIKRERFEKVLALMQKMQDLGQPPQELIGEPLTPGLQFDAQGNPMLPPDMEMCSLM